MAIFLTIKLAWVIQKLLYSPTPRALAEIYKTPLTAMVAATSLCNGSQPTARRPIEGTDNSTVNNINIPLLDAIRICKNDIHDTWNRRYIEKT